MAEADRARGKERDELEIWLKTESGEGGPAGGETRI